MFENYAEVIKKYATFEGRARRREYWLFYLCNFLFETMLLVIQWVLIGAELYNGMYIYGIYGILSGYGGYRFSLIPVMISIVYSLFILVPTISVSVRRLHDTGRSGAYLLMNLIPLAGPIIVLVALCSDGTLGVNQYGRNPKEQNGFEVGYVNPTPPAIQQYPLTATRQMPPPIIEPTVKSRGLRVTCINGPDAGCRADGEVVYIGRNPSLCQLVLSNSAKVGVSSVHCMIHADNNGIEVRDLGSRNGTFLKNGKKLEPNVPVFLPSGSTLYLGSPQVSVVIDNK